jgi:hypothetical protein
MHCSVQMEDKLRAGTRASFRSNDGDIASELAEVADSAQVAISALDKTFAKCLQSLLDEHSDTMHFDLRFVMMQINFSGFYNASGMASEAF